MKKHLTLLICLFTSVLLLFGCGDQKESAAESSAEAGGAYDTMAEEAAPEMDSGVYNSAAADYEEYESEPMEDRAVEAKTAGETAEPSPSEGEKSAEAPNPLKDRKLITTMNVSAETQTFDETFSRVEQKTQSLGGYIESSDISNGQSYYEIYSGSSSSRRHASLTVRIPAERLSEFLDTVEKESNILSQSRNVQDITLSYVDTESRKNALKAEEKRLLAFMEEAESVEEMLAVEERLTDVRYELERTESELRTYDNQVNFSTVYLSIDEVSVYTEPKPEQTVWSRIKEGFEDSLVDVVDWLVDLFVWIVVHIPQIVVFLIFVGIISLIVVTLDKRSRKKNIRRYEQRKAKEAEEAAARAKLAAPGVPEGATEAGPETKAAGEALAPTEAGPETKPAGETGAPTEAGK